MIFQMGKGIVLLIIIFFSSIVLLAEVKLPSIISDHMVVQQNSDILIWGWADKGEEVKVKGSWDNVIKSTLAGSDGNWNVELETPVSGGTFEIEIEGNNKIIIKDVLVGEVWLASGQSNMAFAIKRSENGEEEILSADYPEIRLFHVIRTESAKPLSDCEGEWVVCSPENVREFSAVAYYFGREIYNKLNSPIGLISSSKGGSPVESWIEESKLKANMHLHDIYEMWEVSENEYPKLKEQYENQLKEWEKTKKITEKSPEDSPNKPKMPRIVSNMERPHRRPSYLYNAMIAPLIQYKIKGVIWYQGENNVGKWEYNGEKINRSVEYGKTFPLLIMDWRSKWKQYDMPFYTVQIATYDYEDDNNNASLVREAQLNSLSLANTGVVVTADIGDINNIHPTNKLDVGKRLSLWALNKTYGFKDVVCSGPLYKNMQTEGDSIRIFFEYIGSGLTTNGDSLTHFQIAGRDRKFYKATAEIEDSTVVVSSENVQYPKAVRYCWNFIDIPNLYNSADLPAVPFRTDNWSIVKEE